MRPKHLPFYPVTSGNGKRWDLRNFLSPLPGKQLSPPLPQQHCSVPQKSAGWRSLKTGNEVNTCSLNTRAPLASKDAQAPNELTGPTELGLGVLAEVSGEGRDLEPLRGCPSRRTLLAASLGTAGIVEGRGAPGGLLLEPPSVGDAPVGRIRLVLEILPRFLISACTQCLQPRRLPSWYLWNIVEHTRYESLRHWRELARPGVYLAPVTFNNCQEPWPWPWPNSHLLLMLLFRGWTSEEINAKVCHQLLH